jgi:subtilisin-like proprotein convertase family protein
MLPHTSFEEGSKFMSWFKANTSAGRLLYSIVILTLVTMGFCIFLSTTQSVDANSGSKAANVVPEATFAANTATLGAIPDSDVGSPACQNNSTTSRDVTFTASGLSGSISSVSVSFSASHTYLQDLEVTLIAPSAQQLLLFSATGTTTTVANSCTGNTNDLSTANTYTFADSASANWWTSAASGNPVPTSTSRTVVSGIGGTTNPPATTSLNTAFAGATANGTWTLRFRDRGAGDTGTVTAASLTITTSAVAPTQHVIDYNGDGKSDYSVVRNTGGGSGGQVTWFNSINGTGVTAAYAWGISTDFFTPCDFDGDAKTDIAVWRPSTPGNSFFYILQSQTSTLRLVNFGQSGDDPTVIGDYDGDGKCDPAVYRAGLVAGAQSTWYYLGSLSNPSNNITYVPWGLNGDFPAPGDYNGDGKGDFVVQRNDGGGNARFWELLSNGTTDNTNVFGFPTDVIVPGDYDGDGKTDLAIVRGVSGAIQWWQKLSSTGTVQAATFGLSATDFPTQGDYDGDGKTDIAIWRPSATAGASAFWIAGSAGNTFAVPFGQNGDYPVANYNAH